MTTRTCTRTMTSKYDESKWKYGYLTVKCKCGYPTGMNGKHVRPTGECLVCRSQGTEFTPVCELCGITDNIFRIGVITRCISCKLLEMRGENPVSSGPRCIYCETKTDPSYDVCCGCTIEPFNTSYVKPAIQ